MQPAQYVHHYIVLAIALATVWLGLSGHFSILMLSIGAFCVAFCVWIAARMEVFDAEVHLAQFRLQPCLMYALWLSREIVISAVDVSKRVLDPR
jgi:multicomponent Na+:H+ antiporter subunit E